MAFCPVSSAQSASSFRSPKSPTPQLPSERRENTEMIAQILQQKEIEFYIGKYQAVGMVYPFNGQTYIVTAAAYDGYGHTNLLELQKTLVILFFIGLLLLFILKSATKPLNVLIAFTRPLITEFADNLNLKHPLLPTISPYPTM